MHLNNVRSRINEPKELGTAFFMFDYLRNAAHSCETTLPLASQ